ncbi:MAG TPA: polysaccharide biosynthesis tyrosine autokinase [Verrucomicrobiae bacterium]|nr:polysaccharide biosynthesis tyrosine autokinase [Verrucomicrobiae bacterium]
MSAAGPNQTQHRELDLPELLAVLARNRWLFAGIVAGTLALGALYLLLAPPVYRADALVQVETEQESVNALLGDVATLLGAQTPVAAEIEILRSRKVLGAAIDQLGLEIVSQPDRMPLFGAAWARWNGKPAPTIAIGKLEVPPLYLEEWLALEVGSDGNYSLRAPDGEPVPNAVVEIGAVEAPAGTTFELMRRDRDELMEELGERLEIAERGKQSGIIGIRFEDTDRVRAAALVNALAEAWLQQNIARRSAEAQQTLAFLDTQLPKVRAGVESSEAALNQFRLKQGSADLAKETELVLQHSVALETRRAELAQNREALLQRFTATHPAIQALDAQLREVARDQAGVMARVKRLPETQQEVLGLTRDAQVNAQIYTSLLNSAQELQLMKAGTVGNVRIIDTARERLRPARPVPPLVMALCALVGIALGLLGVFVRRALQQGVEDPAVIERALGLPTYATVPFARAQRRFARSQPAGRAALLAQLDAADPAIEALRSLRTSLHFASAESRSNVLVLTGPTAGLGKSFLAMNLGAVLSQARKAVVVIDADLRKGKLHEYAGLARGPGVSEYVAQEASFDSLARATSVAGLHLITTGALPPHPAELLLNDRFAQLVAEASRKFDHVLIDTPPVLAVTDATIIGRLAGATLLVLKSGAHSVRAVEDSLRRLRQAGVEVHGSIFNQAGLPGSSDEYRYAYEYRPEPARKTA